MSNLQRKQAIVEQLTKKLNNKHFYITNSEGLSVQQINELRKLCYEKDIHYQVIKNTLLKKVFTLLTDHSINYTSLENQALKGPTSIFITQNAASEPAKLIQHFHQTNKSKKPLLKGAIVNGEIYIGSASLDELTKIKTKEVLIGELISLLQSPTHRIIRTLKSPQNKLSSIIMKALPKENR